MVSKIRKGITFMIGCWLIGGAIAAVGAALLGGGDDDDDSDDLYQKRAANLRAANKRRHLQSLARKRAQARKDAQRKKEVREEFDGTVSAKFRAFKMRSRIGATLRLTAADCRFKDFARDCVGVTGRVKAAISERFREDRAECAQLDRKVRELDAIIASLKERQR